MFQKVLLPFMLLFSLFSCEQNGDFEPNSLISRDEDTKAEQEAARLSGAPFIMSFTVSPNATYSVGSQILIKAKFSKRTRIINGGTPRIAINVGGTTRYATYVSGSDSLNFTFNFRYTVQLGDLDHDGIELQTPWELNGAVVQDYINLDADLTLTPPNLSGRLVDTANLSLSYASGEFTNLVAPQLTVNSAAGSELYLGTGCLTGGSVVVNSPSVNYTLPLLNSSNTVYVAVGNGSGGYSSCKSINITHDNQAPNSITGILADNDSSDIESATTSWNSTTDNGPSGIDYYQIAVSSTNNATGILPAGNWTNVGTNLFGSIDNGATPYLSALTNYFTLVRAVDKAGNSSALVSSAAWQVAALSPEQITSMSVVNATDESIKVGWPYPDDNGFPVTDYVIQYKLKTDSTWITINDGTSTIRRHTLEGLLSETEYDFRVKAFNGTNFGAWSPVLTGETLPSIAFVTTPYIAINVGGATNNQLVSLDDDNEIYYGDNSASVFNDNSLISADLDRGKTISVPADDFTVVRATKPFFIAGRLGSGGNANKANVVWQTSDWIGKSFLFSHSRSNPMKVKVFAFTNSDVTITNNGAPVAGGTASLSAENGHVFTISSYGSYEISSSGFIMVYGYANSSGTEYTDPKPFLPSSNDLVGIPSRSAKVSSGVSGNNYTVYNSDAVNAARVVNAGATDTFNSRGTRSTYQDHAVRLRSDQPIVANSYADANGNCSSPLVPSAFQKKRFALNVQAEWVAFASTNELTITIHEPNAGGTGFEAPVIVNMTRTGANNNTPTKGYQTRNYRAGTIIEGSAPFQAWYEPLNDTNGANDDETIMFGWD